LPRGATPKPKPPTVRFVEPSGPEEVRSIMLVCGRYDY
jgi:hypothetical protein